MDFYNKLTIVVLVFIVLIIIGLILIIYYKPLADEEEEKVNQINEDYFLPNMQFSNSEGVNNLGGDNNNVVQSNLLANGYSVNNIEENLQELSKCNIYTFENLYNKDLFKPSINNLSKSLNLNYSHIENNVLCLYEDQIAGLQKFHTCEKSNCLTVDGNNISQGVSEIYFTSCNSDLPTCDGGFFSISLNFSQTKNTGIINSNTRCLSVEDIIIPEEIYNEMSQFYKDSGIFTINKDLDSGVSYYNCTISNDLCNTENVRQKFRISRYTFDGNNMVPDDNGFFAEILFRPLNLVLTINEDNNNIIFRSKTNNLPEINWLMMPPLNLSPSKITTKSRYQFSKQFTLQNDTLETDLIKTYNVSTKNSHIPLEPFTVSQGAEILDQSYEWPEECFSFGVNYASSLNQEFKWTNTWTWKVILDKITDINIKSLTYKYVSLGGVSINDNSTFYRSILTNILSKNEDGDEFGADFLVGISAPGSFDVNEYSSMIPTDNVLIDNEVIWQRKSAWDGIIIFPEVYFTGKNINNFPFKEQEIPQGNFFIGTSSPQNKVIYPDKKTGLLNFVDYSKSTYKNNIGVESPVSFTLNTSDIGVSGTGKFVLNLDKNKDQKEVIISSYNIIDPGENCKDITVNITLENGIIIDNIKFFTIPQDMIYKAVPLDTTGGLVLDNVVTKNSNTEIVSAKAINGGYGYQVNFTVRIVQTDSFGNILTEGLTSSTLGELIDNPTDYNGLNHIKVTKSMLNITKPPFSLSPSPNNLLVTDKEEIKLPPEIYNYFQGSNLYNNSPPQMAYLDSETLTVMQKILKNSSDPKTLENFITNSSPGIYPPYTPLNYIKTLQFSTLNYSNLNVNNLSQFDDLILGRFIPYSSFTYPVTNNNVTGNVTLYNNNYTQLIPYGIEKIYESTLSNLDLPTI